MGEKRTYFGGCHCGKVRFKVDLELGTVLSCNCSICSKVASLLAFVPAEQFTLLAGEDAATDYQFGRKRLHHPFCKVCGIHSYAGGAGPDGKEMRAINVRCLDDVDVAGLTVKPFDGKSL